MDAYKIDHVAKLTGLSKHVIRSWERRFDLLNPVRGGNRYRMYTQEDVDLLTYIRRELESGFAIGELAKLGRENLIAQMDHKKAVFDESNESPLVGSMISLKKGFLILKKMIQLLKTYRLNFSLCS